MKKIPPFNDDQFEATLKAIEKRMEKLEKREDRENRKLDEEVEEIDEMTKQDSDASDDDIQRMRKRVKYRRSTIRETKDEYFALKDTLKKLNRAEDVDYDDVRGEVQPS